MTGFGLEFYPLGGDPAVLSEFVVKNRGIMPGLNVMEALKQRDQASICHGIFASQGSDKFMSI